MAAPIYNMFNEAAKQLEKGSAARLFTFAPATPEHRLIYPFWMWHETAHRKPIIVLEMAYNQIVFASRLHPNGQATDLCSEAEGKLNASPVLLDPREVLSTSSEVLRNLFGHCEKRFLRKVADEAIQASADLKRAAVARIASAVLEGDTSSIFA